MFFNLDFKKLIFILLVVVLPFVSINIEESHRNNSLWYSQPFTLLASVIQRSIYEFADTIQKTTSFYVDLLGIKRQNRMLTEYNATLLTEMATFSELKLENDRLREFLDLKKKTKMKVLAAETIARDLISDHATIQINKGTRDGIKNGQAVITTFGVVGHVFRPSTLSSQVLLITDRYSVVDAIVQRTRARGIVEGKSQTNCVLKYVEKLEDVAEGDLVVTSGLDNIFPKGFPVAKVSDVESKGRGYSVRVELTPIVDPRKIDTVLVILDANYEELPVETL